LVKRRCVPTLRATTAVSRRRPRTHDVAGRMAGAAMAETFNEVGAVVPLGALRWIRHERRLVEVKRFPDRKRRADIERQTKIIPARRLPDGLNGRHQISIDRVNVGILHLGEMVVGERGIKMSALAVDTVLHGTMEGLPGPGSNPCLGVRRDV